MTIKPRVILLALPFFLVFALVPVVHLGDKGWVSVWVAYPAFFALLMEGSFFHPKTLFFLGLCAVVIVVHLSLSFGIATLIDKTLSKPKS